MKQFTKKDESFLCEYCGAMVEKLYYTTRDHCPYCLYSKHVDVFPGDRMNSCQGLLKPIGIEKSKKGLKILYRCEKCHKTHKNIAAFDDDYERIIEVSRQV